MKLTCMLNGHTHTIAYYKKPWRTWIPALTSINWKGELTTTEPSYGGFFSFGLHSKCDTCNHEIYVGRNTKLEILKPDFTNEATHERTLKEQIGYV